MRTTLQTVNRNILSNLNRLTSELQEVNQKIGSGKEVAKPSDDPVAMVEILGLRSNIDEMQQYQKNLNHGDNIVTSSENALSQVTTLVIDARVLALQQISATVNSEDWANAAAEVRSILEQTVTLGNTQINDKYIFGGHRTTGYSEEEPTPFMLDRGQGYRLNGNNPTTIDLGAPPALGPSLAAGDLSVNGLDIAASAADGLSDIYDDASAAAKATAINARTADTGVSASVVAAYRQAGGGVEAGALVAGDLVINGVNIVVPAVIAGDTDNALLNAINLQTVNTGVVATRDSGGRLLLAAEDGRNLHIETSANGEQITHLNEDPPLVGAAQNIVYFGAVQLSSDNKFSVATSLAAEAGLAAIGLAGGEAVSGEPDDVAGDGVIMVDDVAWRDGNVRYAGDPDNDLEIGLGNNTLTVGHNGQDSLMDSGVFSALESLENALLGQDYTEVTGRLAATDLTVALSSGGTGLPQADSISNGTFTVTVTDQSYYPPQDLVIGVDVDTANDTLQSMADKINGIPGVQAAWNADGFLEVQSSDPARYSFQLSGDSSRFLELVGLREYDMQLQGIESALGDLEQVFIEITSEVSSFGVMANRVQSQREVLQGLELIATGNLSAVEDTEMVKAFLDLKTKETAYQAALNATAKAMKLSLVDFL